MKKGVYLSAMEILKLKTNLPPIKELLKEIQDPNVRAFTKKGLEEAPDPFWVHPCSIRMAANVELRKFHNPITLTEPGGIINHSIVAVYFALNALRRHLSFRIEIEEIPFQLPKPEWKDMAISATLLHDICKNGDNRIAPWGERVYPEHGKLAATLLSNLPSYLKLNHLQRKNILNGIKWHMGNFIKGFHPGRPFTEFEKVIQEADYYSTRIFLTGVDIQLINYPPKTHVKHGSFL